MSRKTVLVTGASRGIGKAIALKYAGKGYNTVITCIHRKGHGHGMPGMAWGCGGLWEL